MIDYNSNKAIKRREYSKIFTGSNSEGGYQNIYLSFVASTKAFVFEPSKFTYFHFPHSGPPLTIHDADLLTEGAIYGESPHQADKIFKKQANYENQSSWGNSLDVQRGTWLCTWLAAPSGAAPRPAPRPPPRSPTPPEQFTVDVVDTSPGRDFGPQWRDRYYDPGHITFQEALTSTEELYVDNVHVLYDKKSDLTFDPGVLYMYHHVGDDENDIIVDNLNVGNEVLSKVTISVQPRTIEGPLLPPDELPTPEPREVRTVTFLPPENLLKLSIKDWLVDSSTFENTGVLNFPEAIKQEKILDVDTAVLQLSTDVDVNYRIPFNDSYNPTDKFTVNCWVKSEDWNNAKGNQIFGNYFRGGWGLEMSYWRQTLFQSLTAYLPVDPIDISPLIAVFEISKGHLLFGNHNGKFYQDKLVQSTTPGETVTLSGVHVANDHFIWAFTNGTTKMLYKIDYNGDVATTYTYPSAANLVDFDFDSEGVPVVLDTRSPSSPSAFQHDRDTLEVIGVSAMGTPVKKIAFDQRNHLWAWDAIGLVTDHNNNPWTVRSASPNQLWKGATQQTSIGGLNDFHSMKIDAEGYMWILSGARSYQRIDIFSYSTAQLSFSGSIGFETTLANREIGFTKEYVNGAYVDYGYIIQEADRAMYKINPSTGKVLEIIDLTNKMNFFKYPAIPTNEMRFVAKGDFTGTQWAYRFLGNKTKNKPALFYAMAFETPTGEIITRRLSYNPDDITNDEWHMLSLTFDTETGRIIIYNNTIEAASDTVPEGSTIYFRYRNNLVFGGNSGRFYSLDDELGTDQLHFNGSLAEPSIYHRALTPAELTHLFRQKAKARAVKWNAPIGKQVYVEEIERFFKHKLPGSKSNFYNLSLINFGIEDDDLRLMIEDTIRKSIKKVAPVHTELLKIKWQ